MNIDHLPNSVIANGIKAGDLVKIQALKAQRNESLQIRAQHFDRSFGEIIPFVSGDLRRKNSRNQTEFAVQSLFDDGMKLALRPKYLSKVTKICVHRIVEDVTFRELVKYRAIWKNERNEVLFLQFSRDTDEETGIYPRKHQSFHRMNYLLFELCNKDSNNMAMDRAVSSFFPIFRGHLPIEDMRESDIGDIESTMINLPFYTDKFLWQRVIERMKMNSGTSVDERELIGEIEMLTHHHYTTFANISEANSMREVLGGNQAFYEFDCEWSSMISKSFQKNVAFYAKLLNVIRQEMMWLISELHPDYKRLYEGLAADQMNQCVHMDNVQDCHYRMKAMHRLSVIRHYLKANANGHDLHVICYGTNDRGLLQNLSAALAEKVNVEWDINNLNASAHLASKFIVDS